jgi:hypothetical protein
LSARGSPAISGASLWLDAKAEPDDNATALAASNALAPVSAARRRRLDWMETLTALPFHTT